MWQEDWKWVLSVGYAAVGLAWIYPINWLSSRYGKSVTMAVIFALVLVGAIVKWYVYTPGNMWKILIDPIAALSALNHKRETGESQTAEVPVHECIASCIEQVLMFYWYEQTLKTPKDLK